MKKDIKILLSKILSSFLILIIFSFLIPSFAVADTIGDAASTLLTFAQLNALVPGLGGVIAAYNLVGKAGAGVLGYISDGVINALANMLLGGSTALLGLGVQLLNWVVSPDFMKGMGITNNFIIDIGWGTVRNVANIALIFGLIVIAISIILGYQEGKAKKTLINFILIALLINFTPVICGLIVDACNIVMHSFLNSMTVSNGLESAIGGGISKNGTALENFTTSIVFVIFALVGFVIYLLYSILFIARYIVLWILVIASPIAFASKVFPQYTFVKKLFPSIFYWDEWWEQFLQWSILGIIAGFSLFLSNSVMGAIVSNQALITGSVTDKSLNIFYYIVPLVFLISGFFISISYGGKVGAALGGAAVGAWAASGGRMIGKGKEIAGAATDWMGGRAGAAGTWAKEGITGRIGGTISNLAGNENIDTGTKEGREEGRYKFREYMGKPREFAAKHSLVAPETVGKKSEKEVAAETMAKGVSFSNYEKLREQYSQPQRTAIEKKLSEEDLSKFLEGAKTPVELERRLKSVANTGNDKTKNSAYLHTINNPNLAGGSTNWDKVFKTDIGKSISSMSPKDAVENITPESLENVEVFDQLTSKQLKSILERGSRKQTNSVRNIMVGSKKKILSDKKDALENMISLPGSVSQKEEAEKNLEDFNKKMAELIKII